MATRVKPSETLQRFIQAYGSMYAAAKAWGVEYNIVARLMNGEGIGLTSAFVIAKAIGKPLEDLFNCEEVDDDTKTAKAK
jgi:hypothetical protein